jgi:hypothetical protein
MTVQPHCRLASMIFGRLPYRSGDANSAGGIDDRKVHDLVQLQS